MDDLISRQTAIDAVQGIGRLATLPDNDAVVRMSAVEYVLFNLPSEQPEKKSGEWIYDGVKRICPFCKDFIVTGRSIVKYCWNCGARLKERSEDEKIHQQC